MDFNTTYIDNCGPTQIININIPINDISKLEILNNCDEKYDITSLQFAYSLDMVCWSCYMSYQELEKITIELNQDFFIRFKLRNVLGKIWYDNAIIIDYSTDIEGCFEFSAEENSSTYNPYSNMDNAVALGQQLSEAVSQLVGIPCYYIKLTPDKNSKDIVFKEYTLLNVDTIKQIKIVIQDNQMPSSKPEFSDFGLDWQTDWEVEITKGSFATAFGNTAQPLEGDLIYIPMMKRMWMVNSAYEEKKDSLMWVANTFKLGLVKYQEKGSVELGDAQDFVDSVVKNKYEDLFGDDNIGLQSSNEEALDAPLYPQNKIYNVFESDAIRKYVTCDTIDILTNKLYYKGTMISDNYYSFTTQSITSKIIYQKQYCGTDLSISFIIKPFICEKTTNTLLKIGHIHIQIDQNIDYAHIYINKNKEQKIRIPNNIESFIIIKYSKQLNIVELHAYKYEHRENVPLYLLNPSYFYFDIDNPLDNKVYKYDIEFEIVEKTNIEINNLLGTITNIKLFDIYIDNISELLQMYPNNQHLFINDTARKLVDMPGIKPA